MHQFSLAHLAALAVLAVACVTAVIGPGRRPGSWARWAEWTLAGVVFAGWFGEYAAEVILGSRGRCWRPSGHDRRLKPAYQRS